MRYSEIYTLIKSHILAGDTQTVYVIDGSPGCGKSALVKALANDPELGFEYFDDPNCSLLDIPDLAGLALLGDMKSDVLSFKKSPIMAPFQTGRNLLGLEEVGDGPIAMQNLQRRVIHDRRINGLVLSPETYIVGTSNRAKDKAGAGRRSTKLANAVSQVEMETNLDDWIEWAMGVGNIDVMQIQYHRFRAGSNSLDEFDPDAKVSATPRQWEAVNRIPTTLPTNLYFEAVASRVGPGRAAEYTAFRKIAASLVSVDDILINPTGVPLPSDLSAQYAITGAIAHSTTVGNIERVAQFVERLPQDFSIMYWQDALKKTPAVKTTKPFINWAIKHGNALFSA